MWLPNREVLESLGVETHRTWSPLLASSFSPSCKRPHRSNPWCQIPHCQSRRLDVVSFRGTARSPPPRRTPEVDQRSCNLDLHGLNGGEKTISFTGRTHSLIHPRSFVHTLIHARSLIHAHSHAHLGSFAHPCSFARSFRLVRSPTLIHTLIRSHRVYLQKKRGWQNPLEETTLETPGWGH